MNIKQVEEHLDEIGETVQKADGFDDAVIGLTDSWSGNSRPLRLVYDRAKCIEILEKGGMSHEDAEEYFEFNTAGAYVGEDTPVFVTM